jgi:probable rRNA maturation factor
MSTELKSAKMQKTALLKSLFCMCCQILLIHRHSEIPFSIDPESIETVVRFVLESEKQSADFLTVEFLSDARTRQLHKKFFGDPSSTDCMSFPIDIDDHLQPRHLGDLIICPKTALLHAKNDSSLFFDELTLYLVHGMLHLLGYDDIALAPRKKMKQREGKIMKALREHGQILSGKLQL